MKIVLAVDGSENSLRAVERAARLFGPREDCRFIIVTVEENRQWERTLTAANIKELTEKATAILTEAGLTATVILESGLPAPRLVAVAQDQGADLIVMGRRGLNPLARLAAGSVSGAVLRQAQFPVLIVP